MATGLRNFEVDFIWSLPDGRLTDRALGWQRNLYDYIGAREGQIPVTAVGGDGVSTTTFLRSDGTFAVPSYPVGANPTALIGTTAQNGTANTFMRSDAAPAINPGISPTWTSVHTFNGGLLASTLRSTGAFGCNGATAQTSAAVNGAVAGTAGAAYTATEQAILNNAVALLNQIRALLVANGQAV